MQYLSKIYFALVFILAISFFSSCTEKKNSPKSVDEYRAEASAADQEALRLDNIRTAVEKEQLEMDSIYYYSGEKPEFKAKRDSLQHIMDSLDVLIHEQSVIMNRAQHECDSIHHTWAL